MMSLISLPRPAGDAFAALDSAVYLRALGPDERSPLLEIFAGLSPHSREQRFLSPKSTLTTTELHRLASVDNHDHVALLAISARDGATIGVARFVRDRRLTDTAEVAITVVDAWQGRGVGTRLLAALAERGRQERVRCFTFVLQEDNEAVIRLIRHTMQNVERIAIDRGTVEFSATLPHPPPPPTRH